MTYLVTYSWRAEYGPTTASQYVFGDLAKIIAAIEKLPEGQVMCFEKIGTRDSDSTEGQSALGLP